MKKHIILIFSVVMSLLICSSAVSFATDSTCGLSKINNLPKNSMERYAYSKAIENGTSFEEELQKEKASITPMSNDEYIVYVTKEKEAGTVRTNVGTFKPIITSEAKVVKTRKNSKTVRVEDFGMPYVSISNANANWSGGGFNINRTSDKSARISTTGEFIIDKGGISIGLDIVSVTQSRYAKTKTMTLVANMSW